MTIEISVTEARADFSDLINKVGYGRERVVITRHGKPLVALIPASDAASLWAIQDSTTVTVLDLGSRTGLASAPLGTAAQQWSETRAEHGE
jgi:prevent-host-death family protein